MKKTIMVLAALFASVVLVACGKSNSETASDGWDTYKKEKSITIGFDKTFVPMGFEDKDGTYVGFDVDLATAVFAEHGITVDWQPIDWDLKETELKNGTIDLIWNGYTATDERREKVLFTESYMTNQQVLVAKKSSGIESLADMKDKRLAAQAGSSGYEAFEAQPEILKEKVADADAVQYSTFNEALIDLKNDRVDVLLIDRVYANYYLQQEGILDQYTIIDAGYSTESFGVGARKADKTLVKNINETFVKLYKDGTFQEISDKWFGEDIATDAVKGN